jgi:hypothetical protein
MSNRWKRGHLLVVQWARSTFHDLRYTVIGSRVGRGSIGYEAEQWGRRRRREAGSRTFSQGTSEESRTQLGFFLGRSWNLPSSQLTFSGWREYQRDEPPKSANLGTHLIHRLPNFTLFHRFINSGKLRFVDKGFESAVRFAL